MEDAAGTQVGQGVKIIMTSALSDSRSVIGSFGAFCDAYIVKPIDKAVLIDHLNAFGLIEGAGCSGDRG